MERNREKEAAPTRGDAFRRSCILIFVCMLNVVVVVVVVLLATHFPHLWNGME